MAWKLFQDSKRNNCRTHLICFSPLWKHCPALPDVHSYKSLFYIFMWFFSLGILFVIFLDIVVSGRRVNLDLLFHLGQIRSLLEKFLTFNFKNYSNVHKSCENSKMNTYIPFYLHSAIANILPHLFYLSR